MAESWGDRPPPIIIVSGDGFSAMGDGRGRVTYAAYKNITLETWTLNYIGGNTTTSVMNVISKLKLMSVISKLKLMSGVRENILE